MQLQIKQAYAWGMGVMVVLGALTTGAAMMSTNSGDRAAQAAQNRFDSQLLADELRQTSDDLTRLARTFVVSADPKWAQQYAELAAARAAQQGWSRTALASTALLVGMMVAGLLYLRRRTGALIGSLGLVANGISQGSSTRRSTCRSVTTRAR